MTKAEREWFDRITSLGCIVGRIMGGRCEGPLERHHITSGGRRTGHTQSIPLCVGHHRSGKNNDYIASIHPWKREFTRRYGSEQELLDETKRLVNLGKVKAA